MLEVDAFREIHRSWQRVGYPFAALTPSYAASLGASGDRPSSLAELMGILVNDGVRQPTARIDSVLMAQATPYETHVALRGPAAERVLPVEVARTARRALFDVVENGTARRLSGILKDAGGNVIAIGGKTGTGDHRNTAYGRNGEVISSRVVSRTATFAFLIGDRYYGTIMAYVGAPHAQNYKFTSALPTQLLKAMAPALLDMLDDEHCGEGRGRSNFVVQWRDQERPSPEGAAMVATAPEPTAVADVQVPAESRPEATTGGVHETGAAIPVTAPARGPTVVPVAAPAPASPAAKVAPRAALPGKRAVPVQARTPSSAPARRADAAVASKVARL